MVLLRLRCSEFYRDLLFCLHYEDEGCFRELLKSYGGSKNVKRLIAECEKVKFDRLLHAQGVC